jgi:hypothetical protein
MIVEPLVLKLTQGKELMAELVLTPSQGATPMAVNYLCVLDSDTDKAINLENIPRRADPLQVAADALHLMGYPYSGRKPVKAAAKKTHTPPQLVAK